VGMVDIEDEEKLRNGSRAVTVPAVWEK